MYKIIYWQDKWFDIKYILHLLNWSDFWQQKPFKTLVFMGKIKKSKKKWKNEKKLLTTAFINVILYEQPKEVGCKWSLKTK